MNRAAEKNSLSLSMVSSGSRAGALLIFLGNRLEIVESVRKHGIEPGEASE